MSTLQSRALLAIGCAIVAAFSAVLLLASPGAGPAAQSMSTLKKPTELTPSALEGVAERSATPVFWASALRDRRLEVTRGDDGSTWVRYLPSDAPVGDRRPNYLTVGTYPMKGARARADQAVGRRGFARQTTPDGWMAVWDKRRPKSVYMTRADQNVLVEVFSPQDGRAKHVALAGLVQPVN